MNTEDVVSSADLSDEFIEWISQKSGFILEARADDYGILALDFSRGETRKLIERTPDGWIRVWEAYGGGRPVWDFDASELRFAEKRIALEVGRSIRSELVDGPFLDLRERSDGSCAPGWECEQGVLEEVRYEGQPMRVEVLKFGGVPVARFRTEYLTSYGTSASHYFDEDLSTIIASLLDPSGRPLFFPQKRG